MTLSKKFLVGLAAWAAVVVAAVLCVCSAPDYCGEKTLQEKQFCFKDSAYEKCGGSSYKPDAEFCHSDGGVYPKCGGKAYNPKVEFCGENAALYPLCGGRKYNTMSEFCYNAALYSTCNGKDYDPGVGQRCSSNGRVQGSCGYSRYYDLENQFCYKDTIYNKCGDSIYSPATHFCAKNNTVYAKCGGQYVYDPLTQTCENNGVVQATCGNGNYNPVTQFCYGGNAYELCGGQAYNPLEKMCKGSSTVYYVTVAFDLNGATDVSVPPSKKMEKYGSIVLPTRNEVLRDGYYLKSWTTQPNGSGTAYDPGATFKDSYYDIGSTVTLYAIWRALCTVTFDVNGGDNAVAARVTYAGDYIYLPKPVRTGYYFAGWNSMPEGNDENTYIAGVDRFYVYGNYTMYARWSTEVQYYLYTEIDANVGGKVVRSPNAYYYSAGTEVTLTGVAWSGWRFTCWNGDGMNRVKTNPLTIKMDRDKTIMAVFD